MSWLHEPKYSFDSKGNTRCVKVTDITYSNEKTTRSDSATTCPVPFSMSNLLVSCKEQIFHGSIASHSMDSTQIASKRDIPMRVGHA